MGKMIQHFSAHRFIAMHIATVPHHGFEQLPLSFDSSGYSDPGDVLAQDRLSHHHQPGHVRVPCDQIPHVGLYLLVACVSLQSKSIILILRGPENSISVERRNQFFRWLNALNAIVRPMRGRFETMR